MSCNHLFNHDLKSLSYIQACWLFFMITIHWITIQIKIWSANNSPQSKIVSQFSLAPVPSFIRIVRQVVRPDINFSPSFLSRINAASPAPLSKHLGRFLDRVDLVAWYRSLHHCHRLLLLVLNWQRHWLYPAHYRLTHWPALRGFDAPQELDVGGVGLFPGCYLVRLLVLRHPRYLVYHVLFNAICYTL